MRYYETIYIVNPNLDSKVLKAILDDVKKELDKTKSEIINHYNWGKKRLAYQIENQKYGSYIIIHIEKIENQKYIGREAEND